MTTSAVLFLILLGVLLLYGVLNWRSKRHIDISRYVLHSGKVTSPVRIALVSDLHSCLYGENQSRLMAALDEAAPQVVALCGDFVNLHGSDRNSMTFLRQAAQKYPCCFCTGNHEFTKRYTTAFKASLRSMGIVVPEGDCYYTFVGDQRLLFCGVDDESCGKGIFLSQMAKAARGLEPDLFSVILLHRPNRAADVLSLGFDLMLSGHAHGGQWRIPGTGRGVFAPNQGLLPKYVDGLYDFSGHTLAVSRGLSKKPRWAARFFNPPEITVIDILPEEQKSI